MKMQTILGSGGVIATELASALIQYTSDIRLVSRNPKKVNVTDEIFTADLMVKDEVIKAVSNSEVVYLTVGFPYSTKLWEEKWPIVMENVIAACKQHNSKLVFLDNIYMYDPLYVGFMNEHTPIKPTSRKGEVRAKIANRILEEIERGKLIALIARSADFYGPNIEKNSMLTETVFKNLAKGKKADWLISTEYKHSFTYTPDAGRALAMLGNAREAYNQVWHLPTASNPLTGKEWIENIATSLDKKPEVRMASKSLVSILGWFNPMMKELKEMIYQYDRDYVFSSEKFEKHFDLEPTPYLQGIKDIARKEYGMK